MPLFNKNGEVLNLVKQRNFDLEKELQNLIENNLEEIFSCKFVASEFSTGSVHNGRIDTIAISEDKNPVIIEYKKVESSSLLTQSLYYLSWLKDHQGDFQIAVNKSLGEVEIDWSAIRVICIAPDYKKYDLHAAEMMGAPIELWKYKNYENGMFSLEEVFSREKIIKPKPKQEIQVIEPPVWTYERHYNKLGSSVLKELLEEIREYTFGLDESVEEAPKKFYIAYKVAKNFMCIETFKKKMLLYLKFTSEDIEKYNTVGRDVTNIGHFGTGNFEFAISGREDMELAKELIRVSFEGIGE